MQKINLWDLSDEKIKIKINKEIRNNLLSEALKIFNSDKKIATYFGISTERFHMLKIGKSSIPLTFIIKIIDKLSQKNKLLYRNMIESNLNEIKFGKSSKSKPIQNPKFPIKFSIKLARVAGHIIGDGGMRRKSTDVTVYYANNNWQLVNQFENDILDIFGKINFKEYKHLNAKIVILPSIVGFILTQFLGEQQNQTKHVPGIIFNLDKEIQAVFLRSLYDDEGSVSIESNCILFKMTSKKTVEDCQKLLRNFSIKPGEIKFKDGTNTNEKRIYYFYLSGRPDLEKFTKYIGFEHSHKLRKLDKLLSNYKKEGFKQGETRERIFSQIQTNDGITVKELSKKLRIPPSAIRMHTRKMKNRGLIKAIKPQYEEIFFK